MITDVEQLGNKYRSLIVVRIWPYTYGPGGFTWCGVALCWGHENRIIDWDWVFNGGLAKFDTAGLGADEFHVAFVDENGDEVTDRSPTIKPGSLVLVYDL